MTMRRLLLTLCIPAIIAIVLAACGSGGDEAAPGDTDGDQSTGCTFCATDLDCSAGEFCSAEGCCELDIDGDVVVTDGDSTDGDIEDGDYVPDGDIVGPGIRCPDDVQFGAVLIGEETTINMQIASIGTEPLIIRAMEILQDEEEFVINDRPELPREMNPGVSLTVSITFTPSYGHAASIPLQVGSNASNQPLCTILLQSEYKGVSDLDFTPTDLLFGNNRVGDPGLPLDLELCNVMPLADGNKAISIKGLGFKFPDTVPFFRLVLPEEDWPNDPLPQTPVFLNPDDCKTVTVVYEPTEPTFWPQEHENFLIVDHDADQVGELQGTGRTEIRMAGTANPNSLSVQPNPIDFGEVVVGETGVENLVIQNQTSRDIEVESITISGTNCMEYQLFMGDHTTPFTIVKDEIITDIGAGYTPIRAYPSDGCKLVFSTDLPGASAFVQVTLQGRGREANEKPVARVSRSANGADITQPIDIPASATEAQRRISLHGDISYDPDDGYPLEYKWSWIEKPDPSNAYFMPTDTDPIVRVDVDWPGTYLLQLEVQDTEGLWSNPKTVMINLGGNEKIVIDMTFSGDGESNVDLVWRAPNGAICSDTVMSSQRSCNLGDYGFPIVSNNTNQYDNGNRETIVHSDAPNGAYIIQAVYTNDCSGWLPLVIPICLGRENANITVKIYVNDDTEPRWTLTDRLNDAGEITEWYINKVGGTWNEPTH